MASTPKQKETASEKANVEISLKKYADFRKRFFPGEEKMFGGIEERHGPQYQSYQKGKVLADINQAYAEPEKTLKTGLLGKGVDPSSGIFVGSRGGMGLSRGLALSKAGQGSAMANETAHINDLMGAIRMGRGIAQSGQVGLAGNAALANNLESSKREIAAASNAATGRTIGSLVGGLGRAGQAAYIAYNQPEDFTQLSPTDPSLGGGIAGETFKGAGLY
jgi:hypothetical protein